MKWNSVLWAISLALLSPGVWPAEHAAAQQLAFRRDVPAPVARGCTDVTAAPAGTAQDAAEAARLLASARQAALLGDPRAAEDLLANAAALDTAAANIAFLHARALEEIGEPDRAVSEYCRYLRLAPDAQDADDVRQL
ncbi:MAG TPA: hypothetical protein VHG09_12770, partial [Longimicrobiales bacterium]|nr:hypothetical protein [Longimicrobiales bacterium]